MESMVRSSGGCGRCQIGRPGTRNTDAGLSTASPAAKEPHIVAGRSHNGGYVPGCGGDRAHDPCGRKRPAGLFDHVHGTTVEQFVGAAAADACFAVWLCRAGFITGSGRHLRSDFVFRQTAHARTGYSDGPGRANWRRAEADPHARVETVISWGCHRIDGSFLSDGVDEILVV